MIACVFLFPLFCSAPLAVIAVHGRLALQHNTMGETYRQVDEGREERKKEKGVLEATTSSHFLFLLRMLTLPRRFVTA